MAERQLEMDTITATIKEVKAKTEDLERRSQIPEERSRLKVERLIASEIFMFIIYWSKVGGSDDRYVRVWDLMSGQCVRVFSGHKGAVRSVKVSSCGRYLISIGAEGAVVVWDLAMQRMLSMQETVSCTAMTSIALSRDGSAFAVGRPDSAVSIFSLDTATTITDNVAMDPRFE